jgi:hypothetical protein
MCCWLFPLRTTQQVLSSCEDHQALKHHHRVCSKQAADATGLIKQRLPAPPWAATTAAAAAAADVCLGHVVLCCHVSEPSHCHELQCCLLQVLAPKQLALPHLLLLLLLLALPKLLLLAHPKLLLLLLLLTLRPSVRSQSLLCWGQQVGHEPASTAGGLWQQQRKEGGMCLE